MVNWDKDDLVKKLGNAIIQRFHLGTDRDERNLFEFRNTAGFSEGAFDAEYFGYRFRIGFEEGVEKHFSIDISSAQIGLEGIAGYIGREVENGDVFLKGTLSFIGKGPDIQKFPERLVYAGMQETEFEYAPGRAIPVIRVSYRIKEPLLELNQNKFNSTILNFAILPLFVYALDNRER